MSGIELLIGGLMSGLSSAATAATGAVASGVTAVGGVGNAIQLGGTLLSAAGTVAGASAAKDAANAEAASLKAKGTEEFAAAQREAEKKRREGEYVRSRQLAVAAGSGGGTGGSARDIMASTMGEVREDEAVSYYQGANAKRGLYYDAKLTKAKAKGDYTGTLIGAGASTLTGIGKIYG